MTIVLACVFACVAVVLVPLALAAFAALLDAAIRIGPYLVVIWLFMRFCG